MTTTLEIRNKTGKLVGKKELSPEKPLSIGRHQANDIAIADASVRSLHCRIGWNQTGFEIVAATNDGVEVNGQSVKRRMLQNGDLLRVGSYDMTVVIEGKQPQKRAAQPAGPAGGKAADEFELVPLDDDEIPPFDDELEDDGEEIKLDPSYYEQPKKAARSAKKKKRGGSAKPSTDDDELEFLDDDEPLDDVEFLDDDAAGPVVDFADEVDAEATGGRVLSRRRSSEEGSHPVARGPAGGGGEDDEAVVTAQGESLVGTIRERITAKHRPGEEDPVRSPFVLGLGIGAAVLVLAAATFWFIIGRETVERQLSAARAARDSGRYTQAIEAFEDFLLTHHRHELAGQVRIELGTTRIDKEIAGSTPSWKAGLEMLDRFITENRDEENFSEQHETIRNYAYQIALGAAKQAEKDRNRELVDVSNEATTLLVRYSPKDSPPIKEQREIREAVELAEAAILKRETLEAAVADMQKAVADGQPMLALERRMQLLDRYPELKDDREVAAQMQAALDKERELIVFESLGVGGQVDDHSEPIRATLSLATQTRSSTSVQSQGRTVPAIARDCCYGVDAETGDPVWRRVVGFDLPFFPMTVEAGTPGVLLFDTNRGELLLLSRADGSLQWRQPMPDAISGAPLVADGQIYLPTLSRRLYKINLESGRITGRLTFTQRLRASPVLLRDREHLVVAGDAAVLYVLSTRPLECVSVTYTAHREGTIQAPLLAMGELVLMAENDRLDECRLRVFRTANLSQSLPEVAGVRLPGHVRDAPVLRGKQLFVPLTGERLAAYTVSDDPNLETLTEVARLTERSDYDGPIYLLPGPDDQLWMGTRSLKRFELDISAIHADAKQISQGQIAQPIQAIGDRLFVARRVPGSASIAFIQAEGRTMTSQWKTVLGSRILAWLSSGQEGRLAFTDAGDVFYVGPPDLEKGGFKQRPDVQLRLPAGLNSALQAAETFGDRVTIFCGEDEPSAWIINRQGQIERLVRFEEPLQAPPVELDAGTVLPLPGRLSISLRSSQAKPESLLLPAGGELPPQWTQVIRRNADECVAVLQSGRVLRVQYRTQPVPHLRELDKLELNAAADVPGVVWGDHFALATENGRTVVLNTGNLEIESQVELSGVPSNPLWYAGNRLLVELDGTTLVCLDPADGLKENWRLPLAGEGLAGRPLHRGGEFFVAERTGAVHRVAAENGRVAATAQLPQHADGSVIDIADAVLVTSVDGTLYRVDGALSGTPPTAETSAAESTESARSSDLTTSSDSAAIVRAATPRSKPVRRPTSIPTRVANGL